MSTLQDSDLFIVDRNGTNYQLPNSQMSTVQDTDLFVVERDGVNYKVEGKDVAGPGGSFDQPVSVLTPLNGAGLNAGQSYEPLSSTLVSSSPSAATVNFSTTLYTGDGTQTARSIPTGINNTDKSLLWIKAREQSEQHCLFDTERTGSNGKPATLSSNTTLASTDSIDTLQSLDNNGFTLKGWDNWTNAGNKNYVAWNFRAAPGFMDVVIYSGSGSTQNVPHSLAATPGVILCKPSSATGSWRVYHQDIGNNKELVLNSTQAQSGSTVWNSATPTSTNFTVNGSDTNSSGTDYVAYLFASDDTSIKCGKYTGNGSNTGPVITTGFKPVWVMIKCTSTTGNWQIVDNQRDNGQDSIKANSTDPEQDGVYPVTFTDTGFEVNTNSTDTNRIDAEFIYIAIADTSDVDPPTDLTFVDNTELENIIGPVRMVDVNGDLKTPVTSAITGTTAVTGDNYFTNTLYNGTDSNQDITSGVDNTDKSLIWIKSTTGSDPPVMFDTERGVYKYLNTSSSSAQSNSASSLRAFNVDGFTVGGDPVVGNSTFIPYIAWDFKAAPGFMDIVKYVGGTENQEVPHSLGSKPGMMIIKDLNATTNWIVYHQSLGATKFLALNSNGSFSSSGNLAWNNTEPTSSVFTVGSTGWDGTNQTGSNYIAYLFASDDTNIKCGSYTGASGGNPQNCGFKPGWIMIRNASAGENGEWLVFDSKRGLDQGGTDSPVDAPAIAVNTTETSGWAENRITSTDTGFKFATTEQGGSVNGTNSSYIYVAIREGAGSPDTTALTLTDNKDLEFFSPGDAVTGPAGTPVTADVFSTTIYTATSSNTNITTGIDNTSKSMIWIKSTKQTTNHYIVDTERGPSYPTAPDIAGIYPNLANPETSAGGGVNSLAAGAYAINTTGFYLTGGSEMNNASGYQYVAWNFRAAPGFMDVVTFTGTGVAGTAIPHALASTPGVVLVKQTNTTRNWYMQHIELGPNAFIQLNNNEAQATNGNIFNNTLATDTEFFLGDLVATNESGGEYVAYLFGNNNTNIKCGSYTGNGQDYRAIDCGFEAGWVMIRRTDNPEDWVIWDSQRGSNALEANSDRPNDPAPDKFYEFNETGFQVMSNGSTNAAGANYIYVAIAANATADILPPPASGEVVSSNPSGPTLELSNVGGTWKNGDIATGPILNTVSNNVIGQSGNTLTVTDTTGNWLPGLHAQGATITEQAPSPESIVFTSMNDGTTPVTGVDATLARRKWTLEKSDSASGPWVVVGVYNDSAANASQDGATPWGNPPLEPNTFYQVKVMYESGNAKSVESLYNTFKTGNA